MTDAVQAWRARARRRSGPLGGHAGQRILAAVELATGAAGVVGGALLAVEPDGSLLRADPRVLAGSPFADWRIPGVLLMALVGGGFVLAGCMQWRDRPYARELSLAAGAGLIAFESAELAWIGFQPLEAVFAGVGVLVIGLAWRSPAATREPAGDRWLAG